MFRKPKSKFYWYDFTVRGQRYRGSTQETNATRATKVASLKFAGVIEGTDPLPTKPFTLGEFSQRFLAWVDDARLEDATKTYYRNGWRLLKAKDVANMQLSEITSDCIDRLKFADSSANANCALRTVRRMLYKAEEWKLIARAPKVKLMKEYGRSLRLDDDAERKLLAAAAICEWRKRTSDLFREIVILMRDTGMRNQRELYRMRIENLDWENRLIFVPDSKTPEGRRLVPMSKRVFEILTIAGAPVGRELGRYYLREELQQEGGATDRGNGSVMVVVATDAPVDARNLKRMAARAMLGLGRTGAAGSNGSGDYVIAFSTAPQMRIHSADKSSLRHIEVLQNDAMSPLFLAVVEATEAAVYNSLLRATTVTGRGHTVEALPLEKTTEILKKYGAIK
jgi:peptidase S58-like protein